MIVDWVLVGIGFAGGSILLSIIWYGYCQVRVDGLQQRISYWRQTAAEEARKAQQQERIADGWRDYAIGAREVPPSAEAWEEESPEIAAAQPITEFQDGGGLIHEVDALAETLPEVVKPLTTFDANEYLRGLAIGEASCER